MKSCFFISIVSIPNIDWNMICYIFNLTQCIGDFIVIFKILELIVNIFY